MSNLRKLFKQGNSTVISIPDYLLQEMGIEAGDFVRITPLRNYQSGYTTLEIQATIPKKSN